MKRDLDLVRGILLRLEAANPGECIEYDSLASEQHPVGEIFEHIRLMKQAGLISDGWQTRGDIDPRALSWEGHEFIANSSNPTIWQKAKETALKEIPAASFSIIAALVKKYAMEALGLV